MGADEERVAGQTVHHAEVRVDAGEVRTAHPTWPLMIDSPSYPLCSYYSRLARINALEPGMMALSDAQLKSKTGEGGTGGVLLALTWRTGEVALNLDGSGSFAIPQYLLISDQPVCITHEFRATDEALSKPYNSNLNPSSIIV